MKPKYFLLLLALIALVTSVSATPVYLTQAIGVTMLGPDGVLVPIGIPVEYMYLYNWISLGFIFLIATSASQRNGEFWAILIPIFAAMFAWWGWLVAPSASQTGGIIICCAIIAVAVYIKGRQQEKFGIAGPGSPFLNLVFWMIIVQASMGFINATGVFTGNAAVTPSTYQNIQLSTDVVNMAQTGGWFDTITSDIYIAGAAMFSAMTMIWKILISVVYFKGLVLSIAPFLSAYSLVSLLLDVFTVAIDVMIAVAIWMWFFKPPIGESL